MTHTTTLTEQPTAVRRATLAPDQLIDWASQACAEVATYLHHRGIPPAGYPFVRCHSPAEDRIEVEAGVPVAAPISGTVPVIPSRLPGGPALVARYTGPDDKICLAQDAIDGWLRTVGAERAGDSWEVFHDLPTCDHLGRRIEVVQPIRF